MGVLSLAGITMSSPVGMISEMSGVDVPPKIGFI